MRWFPAVRNAEGAAFVIRLRCADGAKVPPHWHPTDENVTVPQGTFLIGMGGTFDETKLHAMNVGNFLSMPKEMHHFAMPKGDSIAKVHGVGPLQVNWVHPARVSPPDEPAAKP